MKKLKFNPPVLEFVAHDKHQDDENVETPARFRPARAGCDCQSCRRARGGLTEAQFNEQRQREVERALREQREAQRRAHVPPPPPRR